MIGFRARLDHCTVRYCSDGRLRRRCQSRGRRQRHRRRLRCCDVSSQRRRQRALLATSASSTVTAAAARQARGVNRRAAPRRACAQQSLAAAAVCRQRCQRHGQCRVMMHTCKYHVSSATQQTFLFRVQYIISLLKAIYRHPHLLYTRINQQRSKYMYMHVKHFCFRCS